MRLKKTIFIFLFFLLFLTSSKELVQACSCGTMCTVTAVSTFSVSSWFPSCGSGSYILVDCKDNAGSAGSYSSTDPYAQWNPVGSPTTICQNYCMDGSATDTGVNGTVQETYEIYGGDCVITSNGSGGGGTNTTTTTTTETTTMAEAPTPGTVLISGSTNLDVNAAVSGSYCNQTASSALTIAGVSIAGTDVGGQYTTAYSGSDFSINTFYSGNGMYKVTLDLSGQTGGKNYICSCPAPTDSNNPYVCSYTGVSSPENNVNFYVKEYNLSSNSWLQVFGGNIFGSTAINSPVPYTFCSVDGSCQATLIAPSAGSTNQLSSGFPITNTGDKSKLRSNAILDAYHSYFHLPERSTNVNSYGVFTDIASLSYNYFYNIAENSAQQIGDGQDLEPLLSDWTSTAWWSANDVNYVRVNGNVSIDETQGFNLSSTQKLVVFVDGNLTLDDSNPNDTNRKITSVAKGGFLAFIVSGNILVTPNVGYELNPLVPTVPTVSIANSNVEGVFVADGTLTIQTKSATGEVPPDKKFIGAGTFVGWTNVLTPRTFNDGSFGPVLNNNQAIDNFIYRPDLLANWPTKFKASVSNWREVDPQLINQ